MIRINDNLCIACGKCVDVCPQAFALEGDRVTVKDPDAPCVQQAIAACPQNAIQWDQGSRPSPSDPGSPPGGSGFGGGMGGGRGSGMGGGRGMGSGRGSGMGRGRGTGSGTGSGMGRGMGGGRGSGRGGGRGR